jgi:hypothetical protein
MANAVLPSDVFFVQIITIHTTGPTAAKALVCLRRDPLAEDEHSAGAFIPFQPLPKLQGAHQSLVQGRVLTVAPVS